MPQAIFAEVEHSLRRLGTDYVDPYQIHRMDNSIPIEETLQAPHDVVKAAKARYLGASSMHAWEFAKVLHLQRQHGWAWFVSMQDHYNLLAREEEREMLPLCADEESARSCGAHWLAAASPETTTSRPTGARTTP
jgi:aryl-alcohol dehydrogenase-like predicted oxidoreductase